MHAQNFYRLGEWSLTFLLGEQVHCSNGLECDVGSNIGGVLLSKATALQPPAVLTRSLSCSSFQVDAHVTGRAMLFY